jgi:hypothetical protein
VVALEGNARATDVEDVTAVRARHGRRAGRSIQADFPPGRTHQIRTAVTGAVTARPGALVPWETPGATPSAARTPAVWTGHVVNGRRRGGSRP